MSCLLTQSTNVPNSWGWARLRPETGSSLWAFCRGGRDLFLTHHLLSPRVHISRNLEVEVELGFEPRPSDMGYRHLRQHLNLYPNTCPSYRWAVGSVLSGVH